MSAFLHPCPDNSFQEGLAWIAGTEAPILQRWRRSGECCGSRSSAPEHFGVLSRLCLSLPYQTRTQCSPLWRSSISWAVRVFSPGTVRATCATGYTRGCLASNRAVRTAALGKLDPGLPSIWRNFIGHARTSAVAAGVARSEMARVGTINAIAFAAKRSSAGME